MTRRRLAFILLGAALFGLWITSPAECNGSGTLPAYCTD